VQERGTSLDILVQICREQLALARDASASEGALASLLERKDAVIRRIDFARIGENEESRGQAAEIVELERESLAALTARRDKTASELRKVLSAKSARNAYLRRRLHAEGARLFDGEV
jgi:hypothetical protein